MIYLFMGSALLLCYHLFGYPLILAFLTLFAKKKPCNIGSNPNTWPQVMVLCPAYNEENVIEEKIHSFLSLDYPSDRISLMVISDNSDDTTNVIVQKYVKQYSNIFLTVQTPRKGKPSGHNLVEPNIVADYVVSTDANSLFQPDSIKKMVLILENNPHIGMLSGQLKLEKLNDEDSGEKTYWNYETRIKELESTVCSIICGNGSLFIIRRELFGQIHPASVDDFERTLITLEHGYIAKHYSQSIVYECSTQHPIEEINRKIRIVSREWFALFRHRSLLNPLKHPLIAWTLFSHKILRWLLGCYTIAMTISALFLSSSALFLFISMGLIAIILFGTIELLLERKKHSIKFLKPCAYFVGMNYITIMAFVRFITGNQQTTWETIRQ